MTTSLALAQQDPVLARLESARQALAEAKSLQQVKKIADVAAAAEIYARRQQLGEEAITYAHAIKIEALARLGELLKATAEARERAVKGRPKENVSTGNISLPTLPTLGISRKISMVAQRLATLPPAKLAEVQRGTKTLSRALAECNLEQQLHQIANLPPIQRAPAFHAVVADPPWGLGRIREKAGEAQYPVMTVEEIKAYWSEQNLDSRIASNCHLYLWVINPLLRAGFEVLDAWGFEYKAILTWCKPGIGTGYHFRNSTEHVLFAVRGGLPMKTHDIGTWFQAERGRHSQKPDAFYQLVERASPNPYLELFSRTTREGWTTHGITPTDDPG
jgi:N6-adenosine-specific RNA methylase IME4